MYPFVRQRFLIVCIASLCLGAPLGCSSDTGEENNGACTDCSDADNADTKTPLNDAASDAQDTTTGDADSGSASDSGDSGADVDTGSDSGPSWPIDDGRFGEPENTFTLPAATGGAGLYLTDIQDTYPEIDWQTLDRLYIPAGHYKFITIGNLPDRDPSRPLVITNKGGQVRVGGLDHYYLFGLNGGSNWVLTGRYDPVSETGHADYPGHRGGNFANSQGTYGILIDDDFVRDGNSGLGVGGGATAFEIEYLEITEVGFAGMNIKTDDAGDAHMEDVSIHDNYIHDTGSEGFYIGSTQSQPQHQIRRLELYNNRVLRTGTEAMQIGQVGDDSRIHHNVFGPSAVDWRAAFQAYQDGNLQISIRSGLLELDHNIFIGAGGSWAGIFGADVDGDTRESGDGVNLHHNYFSGTRSLGMYINNTALSPMTYRIANNIFRNYEFRRDEVHTDATPYGHLLRIFNNDIPIEVVDNRYDVSVDFTNRLTDGNGTDGNFTGSGNVGETIAPVTFVAAGVADDFNFLNLEIWADTASLGDDQPVSYPQDFLVTHAGIPYRCKLDPCPAGDVPPDNPNTWEELTPFADDVRVADDSPHQDLGLTPTP
jgi:hypothetical protein